MWYSFTLLALHISFIRCIFPIYNSLFGKLYIVSEHDLKEIVKEREIVYANKQLSVVSHQDGTMPVADSDNACLHSNTILKVTTEERHRMP